MTELTDLSETDGSNTTITGANIAEGCNPSDINNGMRATLGLIRRAFKASIFRVRDTADQTKLLAFNLAPLTTGTTRIITMGDTDVTLRPDIVETKTASGVEVAFTTVPSWARQVVMTGSVLSMDDVADYLIQIGDSGGYEATGYDGGVVSVTGGGNEVQSTAFKISRGFVANLVTGFTATLTLVDASTNTWGFACTLSTTTAVVNIAAGTKSLTGTMDRIRLVNDGSPAADFDAGKVSIQYYA